MPDSVSVIVSVYSKERLAYVIECIDSLKLQTLLPREIILVLDPDEDLTRFYQSKVAKDVRIVVSENRGLSNARNAGVKSASGEIVAFIDDDAVADERWLERLVTAYNDSNVVGAGGFIRPLWETDQPVWFPEELNWIIGCSYKGLPEQRANVRNSIGCNMSFRREIFEKVGYFRTDVGRFGKTLTAGEEPEISMRILSHIQNSRIIYDPSAIVNHRVSRNRVSLQYMWRRSFYEGVSKAMMTNPKHSNSSFLSTENQYLHYLFRTAIPIRMRRIYLLKNLSQLMVLLCASAAVFLGFSAGKLGQR